MAGARSLTALAMVLALLGAGIMLLFQGVGARVPDEVFGRPLANPLTAVVWPMWRGERVPTWWIGGRFSENLASWAFPEWVEALPPARAWYQFLPLVATQAALTALAIWTLRPRRGVTPTPSGD
jgi:hypothetical protein